MPDTLTTNQAIENLLMVLDVVREHMPPDVAGWFADGVDAFMAANGSLDKCLGLAAANGNHAIQEYFIWKRNKYLQEAWKYCEGETDTEISRSLSNAVCEFTNKWPEFSKHKEPDEKWNELRKALFMAHKYGSLPRSPKQLKLVGKPPQEVDAINWFLYNKLA